MKVTTLVVDDEPVARAGLRAMLGAFDWVENDDWPSPRRLANAPP